MNLRADSLSFLFGAALAVSLGATGYAGVPAGYYDTVNASTPATLRQTLHEVIDDHLRIPYTSGSTDTWDVLEMVHENPANSSQILDIYRNRAFNKQGGGNPFYSREHSWPTSYGFPTDVSSNYPYTDCYALFLSDDGYNTSRSNKPFRSCNATCSEQTTDLNDGVGGGSGLYPGNSNWTSGSFTSGTWEVWADRKGDIARALFYLDVRYNGDTHSFTLVDEPDLILTDSEALIASSNTGSNEQVAYMGMLSTLLTWHLTDPVSDWERTKNDIVQTFQGNRNPFVDHPEWVDCIFNGVCTTVDAPSFCDGADNSLFFCPCAAGTPTSGCDIQQATGGVSLTVEEQETNPQNRATVKGEGFPVGGIPAAVVIRGSATVAPTIFGDGVRCVATPLVRLGADIAIGGISRHNFGHGTMAGSGVFYYQLWFRNTPAMYCTPDGFNLSNGRQLTW